MEQLARQFGLSYRYTELHEVWLSKPVPVRQLKNFESHWRFQFADVVAMRARRLSMLTQLLGMGLIDKEQARKMVGLPEIDE